MAMTKELAALVDASPLAITDNELTFMLDHIGDPDGRLRDEIIYTLFGRGFFEGGFDADQRKEVAATILQRNDLWRDIDRPDTDAVFGRTFTALVGTLILNYDGEHAFLTTEQRNTFFQWAVTYLQREKDYRGYVSGHGWAHGVAHGADFLGAAVHHPQFRHTLIPDVQKSVVTVLNRMTTPFLDDEEQRLAAALVLGLNAHNISLREWTDWLAVEHTYLWNKYANDNLASYYRLSAWLRIMQNAYFLLHDDDPARQPCLAFINDYFIQMGFRG
ncbi:DUF2785 domain-containing protein [Schleiferilactobacillus harbinensis]|jgi:hypothetical protein|uniref:DUF2785 domain-containing protein n=2 Tax=Schleiferilactobacillus harbinensis TaxID=304207 RepID=A0ABU7SWE6_9LACO|nr:DUF2785 domain-containing protein [Schleiferilactobacillus harbinensis]HAY52689.1 DUF2785 domain-containing protein [Lactobacillus sp.]KRM29745.1 putative membrane spanning protein [Schleiferilactobacillus harbinensis DSM 16991]QEU47714.1 DUF2785 domain-containing protein [Schleiferilactobacillus harbinensis]QFR63203.1 DUF2785 domain-containing protein [Schleiferilactobacillus harbinensis]GEK06079.1 hypothetical protein LHA01_13180 [Schleiferilactobacillus harbinensis]